MSESLETPYVAKSWCPTCEPSRDQIREILEVAYCTIHTPARGGTADGLMPPETPWCSGGDCDPETNRLFNELFRDGWSNR